jgi:BirA family transcriptional regulator, biotin operon repressor / biotin---[acetyl-CoA-carboxylase] ligase
MTAERVVEIEGWTLHEIASADSTNAVAATQPAWHAVRADVQTAGRGRFQRTWVSDKGGLWLSAVLPAPQRHSAVASPKEPARHGLPMLAGLAVCEALAELGLKDFRMRWPNDVLVNDRKLAGLLLEQFNPDRVVVGIGVNVRNQPAATDPALHYQATRLVEWLAAPPELVALATLLLRHLRLLAEEASLLGFQAMLPRVNALWRAPRQVQLLLDDGLRDGLFTNVNEEGCLILRDPTGRTTAYHPSQVRHVQEL